MSGGLDDDHPCAVIIPILLRRSGKIDECVMSTILVQIRNDIKQGEENDFNVDAKDINLFPRSAPTSRW
jgi:hypothetical protein